MTEKIEHAHTHGHKLVHDHDGYGRHEHWFDHSHTHDHNGNPGDHTVHEHLELTGPLFQHTEHHIEDALGSVDDDLLDGDIEKTVKGTRRLFWGE